VARKPESTYLGPETAAARRMIQPHAHASQHDHPTDPAHLVAHAEAVCRERGLNLTPLRRQVFACLAEGAGPLGAYDVVEQMGRERRISPISVYRALDFLQEAGLIHRIALRNTYLPCHGEHGAGETTVFLVCQTCGGVDEISSPVLAQDLDGLAGRVDFKPSSRTVELEGECAACRQQESG
jgi:Fur family zinc uptake transcriptional regulator